MDLEMTEEGKAAMERGILKAAHRLLTPDAKAERWFWLSFADGSLPARKQSLGCCIVVADDFAEAVAVSHLLKINPGGEVQGMAIEDDGTLDRAMLEFMLNKLRSRDEMEAAGIV